MDYAKIAVKERNAPNAIAKKLHGAKVQRALNQSLQLIGYAQNVYMSGDKKWNKQLNALFVGNLM